jgi:hypothetical protein
VEAMHAAERGGYEALRLVDIPEPRPRTGQALVRVTSAGVTPLDRTVLVGLHRYRQRPDRARPRPVPSRPPRRYATIEDRPFGTVTLTVGGLPSRCCGLRARLRWR